jgi:hypothetical protein
MLLDSGSVLNWASRGLPGRREVPHTKRSKLSPQRPPHLGTAGVGCVFVCARHLQSPRKARFKAEALFGNIVYTRDLRFIKLPLPQSVATELGQTCINPRRRTVRRPPDFDAPDARSLQNQLKANMH